MDISIYLENAILSPDPVQRQNAESELSKLSESNWIQYIGLLIQVLGDETKRTEIRMLAGLNVKNELTSKDLSKKQIQAQRWIQIDQETKNHFKQIALNTLLSNDERVANQAASLVASIAHIELPRSQWPDLIDIIVDNTKPEKPVHVKRASLLTIGYICESADPNNPVVQGYSNGILIAIVQGAQSSEESLIVRKTALNALVNSLEFIESNFQRDGERNYIMQVVCEATASDDYELQALAFGALAKIMSLFYVYMSLYMEKALYNLTVNGMKSENDNVACMAVEFWSTVCEEELDIQINKEEVEATGNLHNEEFVCYNFALIAIPDVLPVLLNLLTKQNEDFEDDTWSVAMAAAACLQLFAQNATNYVVQPTLQFVEANLSSPNWRNREAAVMAFGSILDGPDRNELKNLITQALPPIFSLIKDDNLQVKETVSWCLGRIAELVVDAIDTNTMLPSIINALVDGLRDHPKVATNCCWTLINLTEQLCSDNLVDESSRLNPSILSQYLPTMVPALLEVSSKDDNEHSSRTSSYEALSTLVLYSSNQDLNLVSSIAEEVLRRLELTIKMQLEFQTGKLSLNGEEKALLEELQSNILSLLTNIVRRIGPNIINASDNLMTKLLELLQIQTNDSIIEEDIFMTISSIATAINKNFEKYMPTFLPFLTKQLENVESPICESAIGLVVDICHSLGDSFKPYCQGFMTILGNVITNPNIRQELRPLILSCFGDIASSIGNEFIQYLNAVMEICLSAQTSEVADNSIEQESYILLLQESVLNTYVGIVTGLHENPAALANYLSQLFSFLMMVYGNPLLSNNDDVYRAAAGLIGDLAQIFQDKQPLELYKQEWVTLFLKKAKNNSRYSQSTRDTAKWAREQQKIMLSSLS
jgi:importin subunit beta-1